MSTDDLVFSTRLQQGLRELDGLDQAPDVAATVARRLGNEPPADRPPQASPNRRLVLAAALLGLAVTGTLIVQQRFAGNDEPANATSQDPQPAQGAWRLTYRMPIDAIQRRLGPNRDLERTLDGYIDLVRVRCGSATTVTRIDAATFAIDLDDAAPIRVTELRALVEQQGQLEMRLLANADPIGNNPAFAMQNEVAALQRWLDSGGRKRVLADPAALAEYRPGDDRLRWVPHRIRPNDNRPGRWFVRYSDSHLHVVPVHSDLDWNNGLIPAHIAERNPSAQQLLELVPINMQEEAFTATDFRPSSITLRDAAVADLPHEIDYRLRPERSADFAEFSERHIGRHCATIWNGEMVSAPLFVARIPGLGRMGGLARHQAEGIAAALRAPLPAPPTLLRSAPRPRSAPSQPKKR
ncbi:MAG: hypothetical protein NXI31_07780 [bacterium]|nr:hypothetical protein [bacterium]